MRVLLENGGDPNHPELELGWTPIHIAVFKDALDLLRLLLDPKYKGNPNKPDNNGSTPLHIAIQNRRWNGIEYNIPVIEFLLDHGADPNIPDSDGNTSVHLAMHQIGKDDNYGARRYMILQLLVDRGGDPYIWNKRQTIREIARDVYHMDEKEVNEIEKIMYSGRGNGV
jgi:ankyrin repeat protein